MRLAQRGPMDHFQVSRWTDGGTWVVEVVGFRKHPRTGEVVGLEVLAMKRLKCEKTFANA